MIARISLPHLAVLGIALGTAAQAGAQLAAKSPFMPPQAAASTGPTANAPLEYRGYMETSEGIQFRLYDPGKKIGTWVKLNERNSEIDVVAKQHDGGQLIIEYQGKTLTLEERKSKVVSLGAAAAMPPPAVAPMQTNVAPAVAQTVVLNPTPADEQRRLDAVAAEVARRRALREQATQQMNQGVAPQGNVPQVVQPLPGNYSQPTPQNIQRARGPAQNEIRQR
jgi:hypothetical protein